MSSASSGDQLGGKIVTNPIDVDAFEPLHLEGGVGGTGDRRQGTRRERRQGLQHHLRRARRGPSGRTPARCPHGRGRRGCEGDRQPGIVPPRRPTTHRRRAAPRAREIEALGYLHMAIQSRSAPASLPRSRFSPKPAQSDHNPGRQEPCHSACSAASTSSRAPRRAAPAPRQPRRRRALRVPGNSRVLRAAARTPVPGRRETRSLGAQIGGRQRCRAAHHGRDHTLVADHLPDLGASRSTARRGRTPGSARESTRSQLAMPKSREMTTLIASSA